MNPLHSFVNNLLLDESLAYYNAPLSSTHVSIMEIFLDKTSINAFVSLNDLNLKNDILKFKSTDLSQHLFNKIKHYFKSNVEFNKYSFVDIGHHYKWKPTGISSKFTLYKFKQRNYFYPSYNITPNEDGLFGLKSIYIFFTDKDFTFRFIQDPQEMIPHVNRIFPNLKTKPDSKIIHNTVYPEMGQCLIFDQKRLYDILKNKNTSYILKSSILYKQI